MEHLTAHQLISITLGVLGLFAIIGGVIALVSLREEEPVKPFNPLLETDSYKHLDLPE